MSSKFDKPWRGGAGGGGAHTGGGAPRGSRRGAFSRGRGRHTEGGAGGKADADGDVQMEGARFADNIPRVRIANPKNIPTAGSTAFRRGGAAAAGRGGRGARGSTLSVRAMAAVRGRGGRGGANAGAGSRRPVAGSRVIVSNAQGLTAEDVGAFVVQQVPAAVTIVEVKKTRDDTSVIITVDSAESAQFLAQLGIVNFNGQSLEVKLMQDGQARAGGLTIQQRIGGEANMGGIDEDKLRTLLASKYESTTNSLNLSRVFREIPGAKVDLNDETTVHLIVKIIGREIPTIGVIDLSDNRIRTLAPFAGLGTAAPSLFALSLKKNDLRDIKELKNLSSLRQLQELIFLENPAQERFRDATAYRTQAREPFPSLKKLDGVELPPVITFAVQADGQSADVQLPPSLESYFTDQGSKGMVLTFLRQYFTAYDADRSQLDLAYSESCVFSLSVFGGGGSAADAGATQQQHRGRGGFGGRGGHQASQRGKAPSTIGAYFPTSRNLAQLKDTNKRVDRLHVGKDDVGGTLVNLSGTMHNVDSFIVDAYICGENLMAISIHGQFLEGSLGNQATRSFDRTFIVRPAQPNPAGWTLTIVNDQLTISEYVPGRTGPSPLPAPPAQSAGLSAEQQAVVLRMSSVTGMTVQYSQQCLETAGWDFDRAGQLFLEKKTTLPREAFMQ